MKSRTLEALASLEAAAPCRPWTLLRRHLGAGIRAAFLALMLLAVASPGFAQTYGTDARGIGMGGTGRESNMAWNLVSPRRPYRSIPVPLGLFQVLNDLEVFDPGSDAFNPSQAMEYATSPMHYTFDRGISSVEEMFMLNLVNGEISRDLNAYRGFAPEPNFTRRGLWSPSWGKTFWLFDNGDTFHGVYGGVGPYMAGGVALEFDDNLTDLFASTADVYLPNASYTILDRTDVQTALSFTGGYRARFPLPDGGSSDRDGIYVAFDYNHLYGIHYEDFDMQVQFDTDDAGLMTLFPTTDPVTLARLTSSEGSGRALDIATAIVVDRWDFTFAVDGVANHIDWSNPRAEQHTLTSVVDGLDFVETSLPAPAGPLRLELPVRYSGGAGYHADRWSALVEMEQGFQDFEFSSGLEYRLGLLELRGGGRYSRDLWHPAGGLGMNLIGGFGVDLAFFGTTAGLERNRKTGMAISLRFKQER